MKTKKYFLGCAVIVIFFVLVVAGHIIVVYQFPRARLYYEVVSVWRERVIESSKCASWDVYVLSKPILLWFMFPFVYTYGYGTLDFKNADLVDLHRSDLSGFDFSNLRGFRHQFKMDLMYSNVTDAQLKTICQFKNIICLDLTNCKNITDDGIREIANLENVWLVRLDGVNCTDAGVRALKDMPKLIALDLVHTHVDGSAFCDPDGWQNVIRLDLTGCVLTDDCFDFMSNIVNLAVLIFSVNDDNYLPPNVENLLRCKNLNSIYISGKNLKNDSDEGLPEEILEKLRTSFKVYVHKLEPAAP